MGKGQKALIVHEVSINPAANAASRANLSLFNASNNP